MVSVYCPYCKQQAALVTGKSIYPHRPDLYKLKFYLCSACDAYVGTHKGTENPLGEPANAGLRAIRSMAHSAFDPIWRKGTMNRGVAYDKLAEAMGIDREKCHIGMFNVEQCQQVISFCKNGFKNVGIS